MDFYAPLLPNHYYHIYNHAVGNENLFRKKDNYTYFLQKYTQYIHPIAQTFAYCLMPNHFHFLIKIRSIDEIIEHYKTLKGKKENEKVGFNVADLNMQQFSNFFNAYAKAYNTVFDRKGSLFVDKVRRKLVYDEQYLSTLIAYIHKNPIHHRFCKNINDWNFSSYATILSQNDTKIERNAVLNLFGEVEAFVDFHKKDWIFPDDLKLE
ncbi:transposase [Emticicia sp. SJ17W-69]|uniref:transposase n=1 Tax=Emticicia sp. SJ17W-69 TaxID=3421657 RepID=UPI003EBC7B33